MTKAHLLSLFICSLVVAGCNPPNPESEKLNLYQGSGDQSGQTTDGTAMQSQAPVPQKGPMKTITDFEEIAATQSTLVTTKGEITFDLYRDKAPLSTANYLNLVKSGFYNGIVFHRIIPDFMAQVGDPLTKDPSKEAMWGSGGPGYTIADEFGEGLMHDSEGMVSMANAGPNTGGSQFFITYGPTAWLDGKHAIFGKVTKGMDVLRNLKVGDSIISASYK